MSGGSFNYLFRTTDLEDLWHKRDNIYKVIGCLYAQGFEEAADEFTGFYKSLDNAVNPYTEDQEPAHGLENWWSQLRWVAQGLEWWQSGDTRREQFRQNWSDYKSTDGLPKNSDSTGEGDASE